MSMSIHKPWNYAILLAVNNMIKLTLFINILHLLSTSYFVYNPIKIDYNRHIVFYANLATILHFFKQLFAF